MYIAGRRLGADSTTMISAPQRAFGEGPLIDTVPFRRDALDSIYARMFAMRTQCTGSLAREDATPPKEEGWPWAGMR